jgi:ribulose-5-phosphate 4-epimerase/fuculose-1-phosphate aldolase
MREVQYPELDSFKQLLQNLGEDFDLVQGFGGNASIKTHTHMLVKASGKRLGSVTDPSYFHEVTHKQGKPVDEILGQLTRPSIEVFLHALLKDTFVLHVHSTRAVAVSMLANDDPSFEEKLDTIGASFLRYLRPGAELSDGIGLALESKESQTFLLGNHGTLFSAQSVESLQQKLGEFEVWSGDYLRANNLGEHSSLGSDSGPHFSPGEHAVWHAKHNWRISPDHCVFLGIEPDEDSLAALAAATSPQDLLTLEAPGNDRPSARSEQLAWFFSVVSLLPRRKLTTLEVEEARYLCAWEAEKHRVKNE